MRRPATTLTFVLLAMLLVGALLAVALLTLNFQVARSETRVGSEVVTSTMEVKEGEVYPPESEVFPYVEGGTNWPSPCGRRCWPASRPPWP